MLSFFKKKQLRYTMVAVNYDFQINLADIEDFDELREFLLDETTKAGKHYTRAEIDAVSKRLEYDLWEAFVWVENDLWEDYLKQATGRRHKFHHSNDIQLVYKFKNIKTGATLSEQSLGINKRQLYTHGEIEKLSQSAGQPLWNSVEWEPFVRQHYCIVEKNLDLKFYKRKMPSAAS